MGVWLWVWGWGGGAMTFPMTTSIFDCANDPSADLIVGVIEIASSDVAIIRLRCHHHGVRALL